MYHHRFGPTRGPISTSDSDDDSNYDEDATIASNRAPGGDSYFDELSLASKDDRDIYGKGTGQTIAQAICPGTIVAIVISLYVAVRLLWLLLGTLQPIPFTTISLETW